MIKAMGCSSVCCKPARAAGSRSGSRGEAAGQHVGTTVFDLIHGLQGLFTLYCLVSREDAEMPTTAASSSR